MLSLARLAARSIWLLSQALYHRRVPHFSADHIARIQSRRVRRIVSHAYENVPFYREVMDQRRLRPEDFQEAADLAKLPLIDKETVHGAPEKFLSQTTATAASVELSTSKGTKVYWEPNALQLGLAVAERERAVWLPLAGGRFGCTQLHLLTPGSGTMAVRALWDRRLFTPRWVARKYYVDPLLPYEEVIARMGEIRPEVAFSYGSYIEHFFRFLLDTGTSPSLPRVWFYGADTLSPTWRTRVEEKFGVKIYSNYATTETARLGFECERRDGYHLNTDLVATRITDSAGNDLPPGQVGEVVVSNLFNRASVLLNYRLGDLAELSPEACTCGRSLPLVRSLHGRVLQTIHLRDGRGITAAVFLGQFRQILDSVFSAQAVPLGPGRLCWQVVPGRHTDIGTFRSAMLARSAEVFGSTLDASVEFVEAIPLTPAGKFEAVRSGSARVTA